jgi:hypothetical protein
VGCKLKQIRRKKTRSWAGFRDNIDGNFGTVFAIMLMPLLIGVGMAVDISRQTQAMTKLQDALDTAAIYSANLVYDSHEELEEKAEAVFEANLEDINFELSDFTVAVQQDGSFMLDAEGSLDTMFMQIGGYPNMDVAAASGAIAKSDTGIEIAIAFDTTASMGFGNSWQNATQTLENVLTKIENYAGQEGFYVSLVPFSDRVQIGTDKADWLVGGVAPANWNGCVEPREENENGFQWSSDADTPSDEPFTASIPGVTGGLAGVFGNGPSCPSVALTGPTSDVASIVAAANSMTTGGTGRFDDAIAWTWRLLSEDWAGLWGPADYPAVSGEHRKIAIFVTDGRTEAYSHELSQERDWGWNQGSEVGFEHMVHVCDEMKNDDIEIYAFRVSGNHHSESYMQSCATDADHYMVIRNNADLELAFLDVLSSVKVDMHLIK